MDYPEFKAGDWVFITYSGHQQQKSPRFVQLEVDSNFRLHKDGARVASISIPDKYNGDGCPWDDVPYWMVLPELDINSAVNTVELATIKHVEQVCEEYSDEIKDHEKEIGLLKRRQNDVSRLQGIFNP